MYWNDVHKLQQRLLIAAYSLIVIIFVLVVIGVVQ